MKLPWKTLYIGKVVEVVKIEEIERYVGKVYAFAVKQTFSEDEAADLSQEILFTAIRSLPTLRDDCKFEFWLWGIAKTYRNPSGAGRDDSVRCFSTMYRRNWLQKVMTMKQKNSIIFCVKRYQCFPPCIAISSFSTTTITFPPRI